MDKTILHRKMKNTQEHNKDERVGQILDTILRFVQSDFKARASISNKGDEIDAIIIGLNTLGEELESKAFFSEENRKKINGIMETLLKYTLMDFSAQISVSEKGDELDAIIVGLNTLGEELESNIMQLKESQEHLEKKSMALALSNKDLEQFAYVASHDLQEPLRMVSSFLQLLEQHLGDKLDKDSKEYIDFAVDGSKRMKNMINDLLSYSRILSRNAKFEKTDIQEVLKNVRSNLKETIDETGVAIKSDNMPVIKTDRIKLSRLFQNLIANAIKFRKKDSTPEIEIKCEEQAAEYLFSVKDNGIGLKKEYHEKIFLIFQRLHSKEEYPGTGIGLAECQKIVELHGGKIWVESEPDKGATFFFTIQKYL